MSAPKFVEVKIEEWQRTIRNERAFHILLEALQRALSSPLSIEHSYKQLAYSLKEAISVSHGETKLHFTNDWLKRTTAADPDVDIEAGPDISGKAP